MQTKYAFVIRLPVIFNDVDMFVSSKRAPSGLTMLERAVGASSPPFLPLCPWGNKDAECVLRCS